MMTCGPRQSFVYLIIPILTFASISPWFRMFRLSPIEIYQEFDWLRLLFALPVYLGMLASPGYVYFWLGHDPNEKMKPSISAWLTVSLYASFLASLLGLISVLAVYPTPFVVASIICTYFMLRKYNLMKAGVTRNERPANQAL